MSGSAIPAASCAAPVIVWLRRDLRLGDNPAVVAAAETGRPVIAVIVRDPLFDALGAAPKWRFGLGLKKFQKQLQSLGSRVILRSGPVFDVLRALMTETGATSLYWNRAYDPESIERDSEVKAQFAAAGIDVRSFSGNLLLEPWKTSTKTGGHFKVYSPFWRALSVHDIPAPIAAPQVLRAPDEWPASETLASWGFGHDMGRGADVVALHLSLGEEAAQARLDRFLETALPDYAKDRDFPARAVTSNLSEPLAYGEISARQIWHQTWLRYPNGEAEKFLKELAWRDFAWHLTYHDPHIQTGCWRQEWDRFNWDTAADHPHLIAWQQGRTGVDLVDAGMRELYTTGRMHNRVRMIVASYLTKHLRMHWRLGQQWFADTLVDWDAASNAMGWQWVAGCGPDAAPYFRIFNPDTQQQKFDAQNAYCRHWLGTGSGFEEAMPLSWKASRPLNPIVPLAQGRTAALAALEAFKATQPEKV
ncbi:deoxyribodipyrimidine photo-lyase [Thalassobius sp. Cn5-15]|uniref:cryptochrome/photolyase family protein n=1 Tax=Thalassobius sp. Cn5-15 TaxID=2917763 RepID=UPI001EF31668|nr:deoxyribodipyrimidine photo-lyase [Thalassobius sp. Cn5-15]MCG7492653.1 DNA photolyase family protein [Thalassobius sp. Cn5-15]